MAHIDNFHNETRKRGNSECIATQRLLDVALVRFNSTAMPSLKSRCRLIAFSLLMRYVML